MAEIIVPVSVPAAATTVTGPDAFGAAAAVGTATTEFALADHGHGLPAAPSDVPLSTVTTAGDLIVATGAGAVTRLGVGTASQALLGGTTPTWGTPPAGALTYAESYITANVSVAAATMVAVTSLSLAAGTWLVTARAFGYDGTSTPGVLALNISPNSASSTGAYAGANVGVGTGAGGVENSSLTIIKVVVLTATTTIYLNAFATNASTVIAVDGNVTPNTPNMSGISAIQIA